MKSAVALVCLIALGWAGDASAASRSSKYHHRYEPSYERPYRSYDRVYRSRSSTVGQNGLCQRDTGTPTSNLNFRNRCDTLEFWDRMERNRGFR